MGFSEEFECSVKVCMQLLKFFHLCNFFVELLNEFCGIEIVKFEYAAHKTETKYLLSTAEIHKYWYQLLKAHIGWLTYTSQYTTFHGLLHASLYHDCMPF